MGRQALHHAIGDLFGVPFVGVADLTDEAFQVNASTLPHDMGGFVGRSMEAGCFRERDLIPLRVGQRSELCSGCAGMATDVAADSRQILARTKRSLDGLEVG